MEAHSDHGGVRPPDKIAPHPLIQLAVLFDDCNARGQEAARDGRAFPDVDALDVAVDFDLYRSAVFDYLQAFNVEKFLAQFIQQMESIISTGKTAELSATFKSGAAYCPMFVVLPKIGPQFVFAEVSQMGATRLPSASPANYFLIQPHEVQACKIQTPFYQFSSYPSPADRDKLLKEFRQKMGIFADLHKRRT